MSEIPDIPDAIPSRVPGVLPRIHSVVAIVVAFAAIALAAWEGLENRRHNRLSVQPRLGVSIELAAEGEQARARMSIESTGLGPAVLRRFQIYLDGVPLSASGPSNNPWDLVIQELAGDGVGITARTFGEGYFLPSGTVVDLFQAVRSGTDRAPLAELLARVAVDLCYCSIYGSDCQQALVAVRDLDVPPC